jgi:hemoglobin
MMPFESDRPAPRQTPFERLGGREVVERVIAAFYRRVAADPELRPLFPDDLEPGIRRQQLFLEQWLGGEPRYFEERGNPMLRRRHFPFVIGARGAELWLQHMREALEECGAERVVVDEIMQRLEPLAYHMVNEGQDVPREPVPELPPSARVRQDRPVIRPSE